MTKYAQHVVNTPQSEPLPGQVENSAGGNSWKVDCWTRLRRFLILGNEGGSYYASERKLTKEAASVVTECYAQDAQRTVDEIVMVSAEGLAPKNDPAIFAMAVLADKPEALAALQRVCRIGTHLFQFIEDAKAMHGSSRARRRAIAKWYNDKTPDSVAYQITKYYNRNGWTHSDVLRFCHAKPASAGHNACFRYAKDWSVESGAPELLSSVKFIRGAEDAKSAAQLIREAELPREVVPTEFLNSVEVWDALLEQMPMGAMIRNLGKMTSVGLLKPLSLQSKMVVDRLNDAVELKKARIHPISVLMARSIYASGKGLKGSLTWNPDVAIVGALDKAFYKAFGSVQQTNKAHLLALDVSGSMGMGTVGGSFLNPREASAAMAMVALKTEPLIHVVGFTSGGSVRYGFGRAPVGEPITPLPLNSSMDLNTAVKTVSDLDFGGTDCALPMIYAMKNRLAVEVFVIYTDSETWAGNIHPSVALKAYRKDSGINAKLIVVGMVANDFTIADPNDPGMMDVVGFDASAPQVMAQFSLEE